MLISKLFTFEGKDMKKSILFGIICFVLTFAACSTRQVMKDCHPLTQGFWDCDKP